MSVIKKEKFDEVVTISDIVDFAVKNIAWILLLSVIAGIAAYFCYVRFVPKKYVSTVKFYASVDYAVTDITGMNTGITYTKSMLDTYVGILDSNDYFQSLSDATGRELSRDYIRGIVALGSVNDTCIISASVTTRSAAESYKIARIIADSAPDTIKNIDDNSIIKVIESPEEASKPTGTNPIVVAVLGAFVGALAAMIICTLKEVLDVKINSQEDLRKKYSEIPILAEVPLLTSTMLKEGVFVDE